MKNAPHRFIRGGGGSGWVKSRVGGSKVGWVGLVQNTPTPLTNNAWPEQAYPPWHCYLLYHVPLRTLPSSTPCIVIALASIVSGWAEELSRSVLQMYLERRILVSPVRLLAGQGGIIGALPCTAAFLHPRHSTVPRIMQNTSVFRAFGHGC